MTGRPEQAGPEPDPGSANGGLLGHLRVAEVSSTLATGFAGRLLAELGARVTAVQPGSGLIGLREAHPELTLLLDYLADGKTSADGATAGAAIGSADLVLTDVRSVSAGAVPDTDRPVALLRMTALDESVGPLDDGILACALAGVTWAIGEPSRYPLPMPGFTADMLVGLVLAGACVAMTEGADGGTREVLGTAALCAFADQNSTSYRLSGVGWRREGRRAPGSAGVYPYGVYSCRDGQVVLIGRSRQDWHEIAAAVGAGAVAERFPDPFEVAARHADTVDALLAPYLARRTKAEVMAVAEASGALIAPVADVPETLGYRHLAEDRDFWRRFEGMLVPGLPMRVNP